MSRVGEVVGSENFLVVVITVKDWPLHPRYKTRYSSSN